MARDGEKLFTCIARNGCTAEFLGLREELFPDTAESEIYVYMQNHYRRHGRIPELETIQTDCGMRVARTPEPIGYYLDKVYDRARYNGVRDLVRPLTDALKDRQLDTAEIVIRDMRTIVDTYTDTRSVIQFRDAADDVLRNYDISHNTIGLSGIDTGCPILNVDTDGWQGGDLVFIVARMGMGKTWYLLKMILGAYQSGHSIMVVTMEMPVIALTRRLVGLLSGFNPNYIKTGTLSTPDRARLEEIVNDIEDNDRLTFVQGDMRQRVSELDALIEERRPDIVYIDGAYLMSPEDKRVTKRVDKMELVVSELKTICNLRNIPIICTSQFNRESKGKGRGGSLETMSYSDAIGTDASLILSIKPGEGVEEDSVRWLEWMKGREGEEGSHKYNFLFAPMNFDYVVDSTDGDEADYSDSENQDNWLPS